MTGSSKDIQCRHRGPDENASPLPQHLSSTNGTGIKNSGMKVTAKMPELLRTQAPIAKKMTIVRMSAVQIIRPRFAMVFGRARGLGRKMKEKRKPATSAIAFPAPR